MKNEYAETATELLRMSSGDPTTRAQAWALLAIAEEMRLDREQRIAEQQRPAPRTW